MPGFRDIIGHEKIIAHMQQAIRTGNVSHAYILDGPEHAGKRMLADAFAMALQCEVQSGEGCLVCRSCKQALSGNQPDIITLQQEKPGSVSVKEVREQINDTVDIRPYSSRYKIYIIEKAQKMTQAAQNALLKTLEEPPSYVVFLLLTTNSESFLQTVRSRCVMLRLQAASEEQIRAFLMKQCRIPDYQADVCSAFAQGNVGRAIRLAGSETFYEQKERMLQSVKKLPDAKPHEAAAWVAEFSDWKDDIYVYLELLLLWYRDVLLMKSEKDTAHLIFSDQTDEIRRQADVWSYARIGSVIEQIHFAEDRIRSNVNKDLVLEVLFYEMRKEWR